MSQIRYSSNKLYIQIKQLDCRYGNFTVIHLINFTREQEQASVYVYLGLVIKMSLDLKVLISSPVWWKQENI